MRWLGAVQELGLKLLFKIFRPLFPALPGKAVVPPDLTLFTKFCEFLAKLMPTGDLHGPAHAT